MFEDLEKEVDGLRRDLYKEFEPRIKELEPVDLNKATATPASSSGGGGHSFPSQGSVLQLPPLGRKLTRPPLAVGQKVVAMRHSQLQAWIHGSIEEAQDPGDADQRLYRVKFVPEGGRKVAQLKVLKVQHVAYSNVSSARLEVGTRCVGLFREHPDQPGQFYSGVVAEPPKPTNRLDNSSRPIVSILSHLLSSTTGTDTLSSLTTATRATCSTRSCGWCAGRPPTCGRMSTPTPGSSSATTWPRSAVCCVDEY